MDDYFDKDDLAGWLGNDRFFIGQFAVGDSIDVGIEASIAPGVTELRIFEEDLTGDDLLATIDLTRDMDVERIVGVLAGDARYDISFTVISAAD